MHRWTTAARLVVATTVIAATAAAITPAVAQAAGPATGVTVFLRGPDNAALVRLAQAHGLTHAQRMRALSALLPSTAEHSQAVAALRAAGMTVTDQNAWSVSATAPSSTVTQTFGAHATAHMHATAAERAAATGPYPTIPATLQSVASAVFPTAGGPAAYHAEDDSCDSCLGGTDFRNAYAAPGTQPSTGLDSAATLTVATVQLAGWNPGDLTNWANTPGNLPGPTPGNPTAPTYNPATGLTMVPVDQASVPAPTHGDNGDEEVDLDQEALLGTDPYAHQRPYFAPNTNAGVADAYSQVVDDVLQDTHAYQGGDPHIVAVSSSWGVCEADTGLPAIQMLEPILTSVLAAGVTIFTATGDQGIYDDCTGTPTDVDYPSASPEAVAVGGTTLAPVGTSLVNNTIVSSAPNNGSNWAETGWSCATEDACVNGSGGSGGGVSQVFAKPSYQSKVTNAPFATVAHRMVPDISADGDPATGIAIFTSDPTDTQNGGANTFQVGGTSLAAPESTALFTDMLAAHGATGGIGDIHQGLYDAYAANVGNFRDITQGSNGALGDAGTDPSVTAGIGYDTVTGLGSPLWSLIGPYLFAAQPVLPPKASGTLALAHPSDPTLARQVTATWASTMSSSGIALGDARVTITRDGQAAPVYSSSTADPTGSYTFTGLAGATYQCTIVSTDVTGLKSKPTTSTISVPIDDKAFRYSGQWSRVSSPNDYAGSAKLSNSRNSYATATAYGSTYALVVETGPSSGRVRISWNGFGLKTINLYSLKPATRLVEFFDSGTDQSRTFKFAVIGPGGPPNPSTGGTVSLDGLVAVY